MSNLLTENHNCWRIARADRFAWLIDGDIYFRALRDCLDRAEREILIVGWDIDSQVELVRDTDNRFHPSPLAATLEALVEKKPDLHVYVLSWDFAMLFVLERELLPAFRFGWQNRERLYFKLDDCHATGASHHQKFVVIDGALAFSGGLDLTKCRWDMPEHAPDDPCRIDPAGNSYRPFHDVQAMLTGEPASHLRKLGAWRWHNATGERLPELDITGNSSLDDYWPDWLDVRARDVTTALARTWRPLDNADPCREVEQLYLDLIATAEHYIYIENQYFTADSVTDALCNRLEQQEGPEILIVLPSETSGWLEQMTMENLRNRCLLRLEASDRFDRLAVTAAISDRLTDTSINVHSKVMVVDGRWLRIGSANTSGRSMRLDSECDVIVETEDRSVADGFCAELLAEHLGADPNDISPVLSEQGLLAVLEEFNGGERRLEPISLEPDDWESTMEPVARIADLEAPIEQAWSVGKAGQVQDRDWFRIVGRTLAVVLIGGLLAWLAWQVRSGSSPMDIPTLKSAAELWYAPFIAVLGFVVGSFLVMPVTAMIAACALLFDPWIASISASVGVLLSASINFWLAQRFSAPILARLPDRVTDRVRKIAKAADFLAVTGLRLIPISPFTVFNLAAGACGVRLHDFILGTLLGMVPGTFLICFTIDQARALFSDEPVLDSRVIAVMVVCGALLVTLRIAIKRNPD